ncbi:MAG: monovalent cation/H+ antiporter subunit D family protein, partial [Gammaproteobacteria bacterium]|nr:monovalent cation/H+ antiporter subunit D family protein [Gammaproteobacteria bacterium]
ILAASVSAIYQWNIKRLLAYSSVAQIGYMAVGIGLGTTLGVTASIVHLFNHALMKGALFMAVGALIYRVGGCYIEDYRGIARRMPWTSAAIVLGGLSLVGVPGTAGFVSKWYLVLAAMEQQAWFVVAVILMGSLIAVVYVGKVIEALYFGFQKEVDPSVKEAPLLLLLPTWTLVLANLYFGLDTDLSVGMAERAVQALGVMAK